MSELVKLTDVTVQAVKTTAPDVTPRQFTPSALQ